jgi:hypothetical protein
MHAPSMDSRHSITLPNPAIWKEFLIANGADSGSQTDGRQTPWTLAVRSGHARVAVFVSTLCRRPGSWN